jgi:hypothetical protein
VQAVVAWLGLWVQPGGQPIEASPRSALGIFFATYWQGSPEQCGTGSGVSDGVGGGGDAAPCAACTFPAAAVIAHAACTLAFLAALWTTAARLAAAVLNTRLKRRVHAFRLSVSALAVAGERLRALRMHACRKLLLPTLCGLLQPTPCGTSSLD